MSTTPQRIGKYELQQLLGSGSVGEVWKSYDLQYHRDVAIKIYYTDLQADPNFMERLLSQGQSLASLDHPNIVRILDANIERPKEANGTMAYMVMDYIEGSTLADSIRNTSRRGAFPAVSDIVSLFTQLGAAIDYAHEHGVIHGNIKPANILLRPPVSEEMREDSTTGGHEDGGRAQGSPLHQTPPPPLRHLSRTYGEPMLVDFGIARATNNGARNSALYISPEQAKGLPPTRHSDIYSLGVILYEICTGVPPFRSESPVVLMMQHINMQPISPTLINSNIPSELSTVILRALAKDSAICFSSASEMAAALADACSVHTVLNNTTVEAKEPDSNMTSREPGKSTGPISTILGVATLPIHAGQPAQLGSSRVTRPLPTIPDSPFAPTWARTSVSMARAATRAPTPLYTSRTPTGRIPYDPVALDTPGRAATRAPTETPPAMVAIPSSQVLAPLSHTLSVSQRPLFLPAPRKVKRLPPIYVWLAATLLLVIVGSVLGTLLWLHSQSAISSHTVVGHIFFQNDSSGQNDVLRVELQNIPDPASGKSYYAWLVMNEQGNLPTPTLLGKLQVSSGQVNFLYPGDAHHSDLLAGVSGLLITEEDANGMPSFPSSKEVYTVEFAQATHPTDANHPSVLNSVRDLLSGEQALNKLGLLGGLAQWLLRNTSKTWLWASNARDYWQGTSTDSKALNFIRGQIVHIVDVLEGKQLDTRDAPIARVALLEQNAEAPSYLDATLSRLNAIASAADATADQKARAAMISGELLQVKNWLQRVHSDAVQLLNMTDQQFQQPQTQPLLDDMVMQANDAYNGQNDLSANAGHHAGMAQIYTDIQRLATFDVVPFKAS